MCDVTMSSHMFVSAGSINDRQIATKTSIHVNKARCLVMLALYAIASASLLSAATSKDNAPGSTQENIPVSFVPTLESAGSHFALAQLKEQPTVKAFFIDSNLENSTASALAPASNLNPHNFASISGPAATTSTSFSKTATGDRYHRSGFRYADLMRQITHRKPLFAGYLSAHDVGQELQLRILGPAPIPVGGENAGDHMQPTFPLFSIAW